MNRRLTTIGSAIIILIVALSALRFVDRFNHTDGDLKFSTADFVNELKPAQKVLLGEEIDINEADEQTFEVLHRIGPKLAKRIVEDRRLNGPFKSVEDLVRVYGVGPKIVQKNRAYLTTFSCPNAEK
jgi:competence ComEA-like helix-hairpin-helix protein